MIPCHLVQPTFEITHLVPLKINGKFLKQLHDGVLAGIFIFQVFETNSKDHFHVPSVKFTQQVHVAALFKQRCQLFICKSFSLLSCNTEERRLGKEGVSTCRSWWSP